MGNVSCTYCNRYYVVIHWQHCIESRSRMSLHTKYSSIIDVMPNKILIYMTVTRCVDKRSAHTLMYALNRLQYYDIQQSTRYMYDITYANINKFIVNCYDTAVFCTCICCCSCNCFCLFVSYSIYRLYLKLRQ